MTAANAARSGRVKFTVELVAEADGVTAVTLNYALGNLLVYR